MLSSSSHVTKPTASAGALVPRFRQLYEDNVRFVWRTVRRLGVREGDVDDVCQQVFVVVHRKLHTFDGSSTVRTWLFGICYRTASDYRRRAHVRREVYSEAPVDRSVPAEQGEHLDRRRARAVLDSILDQLDDDKRAVFVLFEIERVPMKDVAEMVGCPLQTAYSRLQAARREVEAAVCLLHNRGSDG